MCGRWDAHIRALSYPGFKYVILRRTFPELLKSHLVNLPAEMKALGGTFNYNDKKAIYPNGSIGFFSHCQNESDVLNLLSAEFHLMFFDEVSTFDWEMFTKLAISVRVPTGSGLTAMVRAATNPLGASAEMIDRYWVQKDITQEEDETYNPNDWYSIKANLEDNPYIDAKQYRKRFTGLAEHVMKAWVEGEFSIENALFNFRPTKLEMETGERRPYHVIDQIDLPKILKHAVVYRAIDDGWFPDPTVVLWIAHLGNRHIVFNELVKHRTTAEQIAEEIKAEDRRLGVKSVAMTYCDPTMDINTTKDIKTLKEAYESYGIPMESSVNNREMYATVMHNFLAEEAGDGVPRIQFYARGKQGCPYLVRTLPQMRYDDKHPKAMANHRHDHAVVACCYYLLSHSADPRQEIPFGATLPRWMKSKAVQFLIGSNNVRG